MAEQLILNLEVQGSNPGCFVLRVIDAITCGNK